MFVNVSKNLWRVLSFLTKFLFYRRAGAIYSFFINISLTTHIALSFHFGSLHFASSFLLLFGCYGNSCLTVTVVVPQIQLLHLKLLILRLWFENVNWINFYAFPLKDKHVDFVFKLSIILIFSWSSTFEIMRILCFKSLKISK